MKYLAIDPGLRNCAAVIVEVKRGDPLWGRGSPPVSAKLLWSRVASLHVDSGTNPGDSLAEQFGEEVLSAVRTHGPIRRVLVEYQPPLNTASNPALVRWNSWIEGFYLAWFKAAGFDTKRAYSASVRHFFRIEGRTHAVNKRLSVIKALTYLEMEMDEEQSLSDHEADGILMAIYEHTHNF